ncbi:hypothetical protein HJG60_007955 [Phyllostomus discolor]|uniref:Uncharacterized protein n=1 Tax=Phyllostomus discolor TaxID=89673 RepID=A0A834BLC8_9CHIR|nr:hypothetical protein HJG60_007955 [Phyllostomus discolor]
MLSFFYFFSFLSSVMVCCGLQPFCASIHGGYHQFMGPLFFGVLVSLESKLPLQISVISPHTENGSRSLLTSFQKQKQILYERLNYEKQYFNIFRKGIYQLCLNNNKKIEGKKKLFNYINREHRKEKD